MPVKISEEKNLMNYYDGDIMVHGTIYADKSPAIVMRTPDGEPIAKATTNVNELVALPDNCVVIKDYSENVGVLRTMTRNGIVRLTGKVVKLDYEVVNVALIINSSILKEVADAKRRAA